MTYCVGLIYGKSAYLFADSAVTRSGGDAWTPTTSFGEKSFVAPRSSEIVEEAALKIVPVGNRCYIAIAGNIRRACDGIELLRTAYQFDPEVPIPHLLKQLENNLDRRLTENFAYLVARSGPRGAEMWKWESGRLGEYIEVQSHASIGSLRTWHREATTAFTNYLKAAQVSEESLLTVVAAILQSYGLHDYLIDTGIGGAFYGVQVKSRGAEWLPDTNYFLHGSSLTSGLQLISVYCRDEGVAVWSSLTYDTRMFLSCVNSDTARRWLEKWGPAIRHELNQCEARMWVFLGIAARTMFIVDAAKRVNSIPGFRVTVGIRRYDFYFRDPLKAALEIPLLQEPQGASFRLTYCTTDNCLSHAAAMITNSKKFPGRAVPPKDRNR